MTTLAIGASATLALTDYGSASIATNGGFGAAVVTPTGGQLQTIIIGPEPTRRRLGPYPEGASVTLSNQTCGAFDYDAFPSSVSGAGTVQPSAVDLVNLKNPASTAKSRWKVTYISALFPRAIEFSTPLASGLYRVCRVGIEAAPESLVRIADMFLATRSDVERAWITGDPTSEPAIVNVSAPSGSGWTNTANRNPYTPTVGDTLTFSFTGTGLDFTTYCDDRGGLWSVEVDGVVRGSFSCWRVAADYAQSTGVVRGLSRGAHTCVLRFAGADPAHAPSSGPARGWIARSIMTTPTGTDLALYGLARVADIRETYTLVHQLMAPDSNIEVAINSKLSGAGYATQFWPKHGNSAANTQLFTAIYVDGALTSTTDLSATYADADDLTFNQQSTGYNVGASGTTLLDAAITGTVNAEGYKFRAVIKLLQSLDISGAYTCMCPAHNASQVKFISGEIMDVSAYNNALLTPAKQSASGTFLDPSRHPYCLAWEITDPWQSLRLGKLGSEAAWAKVQTRSDGTRFAKAYPLMAALGSTLPAGEQFVVSGRVVGGYAPD